MERPIDARLLLYVITIADEGSITRAATKKLFIAPGSLARDIRNLEKRIGYPLFVRRWGGVTLTPGGEIFAEEARKSLDYSRRAADRGAAASRGEIGVFKVGFTPLLDAARLVEVRSRFAEAMPEVALEFKSAYCSAQLGLVLREVLDAGLIILPSGTEELAARCIWSTTLVVAVPEASELATPEPVCLHELSGQAAIWLSREVNPALHNRLINVCERAGYVPNIAREALTYDEVLDAISSGEGVGFIKQSTARRMHMQGVVFRELQDVRLSIDFGVVHRPEKASLPRHQTLLRLLEELSDCDDSSSRVRLA